MSRSMPIALVSERVIDAENGLLQKLAFLKPEQQVPGPGMQLTVITPTQANSMASILINMQSHPHPLFPQG